MKRQYDIITALDVCVDIILGGKDVRPEFGQKEKNVSDYRLEMGGSACIFACQAAKLGLKTAGAGVARRCFRGTGFENPDEFRRSIRVS